MNCKDAWDDFDGIYLVLSRLQSLQNFDTTKQICHQSFETCQCFWLLIGWKKPSILRDYLNMIYNNRTPMKASFAFGHLHCGFSSLFFLSWCFPKLFLMICEGQRVHIFNSHLRRSLRKVIRESTRRAAKDLIVVNEKNRVDMVDRVEPSVTQNPLERPKVLGLEKKLRIKV